MYNDMSRLIYRPPVAWVLALATTASVALAQPDIPAAPRLHSDVRDAADIFSSEATKKAETALTEIERGTHVSTVIETIETLEGDEIKQAALRRARGSGGRGIYILIAKDETKIQVLVSKEFTGLVSEPQCAAIRDAFIEEFKKRDFDAGLERGVEEIGDVLAKAKADRKSSGLAEGPVRVEGEASATPLVVRDQVRLNLAGARRIIAGAEAKASALGVKVNIAVVDDGGHMLSFARMDGARPASGYTATTKAVTAATFRQATGPIPPGTSSPDVLLNLSLQNAAAASGGRLTTLYGGVPIVVDGQTIGGVGVGGGTGEQDADRGPRGDRRLPGRIAGEARGRTGEDRRDQGRLQAHRDQSRIHNPRREPEVRWRASRSGVDRAHGPFGRRRGTCTTSDPEDRRAIRGDRPRRGRAAAGRSGWKDSLGRGSRPGSSPHQPGSRRVRAIRRRAGTRRRVSARCGAELRQGGDRDGRPGRWSSGPGVGIARAYRGNTSRPRPMRSVRPARPCGCGRRR